MAISWIDVEVDNPDQDEGKLLEIAVVVTDDYGNYPVEYDGPMLVKYSDSEIGKMKMEASGRVRDMHNRSGLWEALHYADDDNSGSLFEIDQSLSDFLNDTRFFSGMMDKHEKINFGGNTVLLDRQFVSRDLGITNSILHHGNVDVHILKTMTEVSNNPAFRTFKRELVFDRSHRALDDVYEAIDMYKFYAHQFGMFV